MNMRSSSLICTMLLLCAGMTQAAEYPKQVKDGRDKLVVIKQQPKRIVSISTFGADLMAGLGLKVAGMSSMGNYKPPFLDHTADQARDLGAAQETNMELLTQLKPDLVIGIRSYTEMYEKKFEEISSFITYDFITLANSNFAIEQVAKAVGKEDQGQRMNQDFAAMLNRYGSKAKGGVSAVFVWHWADVLWAHYDHYLTADIMQALKIRNATGASNTPNMINPHARVMSMEELLKLDPDYIFSFQAGDKAIQSHPAWKRLKAVKNGHAYRVGQQYAEVHGPLARQMVLEEMAWLVYPDSFPRPQHIPDAARAKPLAFRK